MRSLCMRERRVHDELREVDRLRRRFDLLHRRWRRGNLRRCVGSTAEWWARDRHVGDVIGDPRTDRSNGTWDGL